MLSHFDLQWQWTKKEKKEIKKKEQPKCPTIEDWKYYRYIHSEAFCVANKQNHAEEYVMTWKILFMMQFKLKNHVSKAYLKYNAIS